MTDGANNGGRRSEPAIGPKDAAVLGEALEEMLRTAFSHDNFDPFLSKTLNIISGCRLTGAGTRLGLVIKGAPGNPPKALFLRFGKTDRARLLAGRRPGTSGRVFSADITLGNSRAGKLTALAGRSHSGAFALTALLGMAAQFISGRLKNERRDAELAFERDIASSVKHIEELYLSFPGISIGEISRAVLDEARRITGSPFGFAGYIDPASGDMNISSFTTEAWDQCRMKDKPAVFTEFSGLWGWVLKKKKPLLTNRAGSDRRAAGLPRGHIRIEKFLGVPALSGRKLLGMLALANPAADFGQRDLAAAQKLARVYAMILQRKAAEDRQREEDTRFKTIVSSSKDIIYSVDLSGKITFISPRAADYGYDPEDLIGRPVTDFSHPDDKEFIIKAFALAVKTGRTLPILPYRIRRKDGSYFYAEQKSGIVFKNGRPAYITGVIRDVTEQKAIEIQLKESDTLMRTVFDTAKDAIFIKDMNGMYVKVNKAFAALFGLEPNAMLGKTDSDFFDAATAGAVFREDSEVVRTGKTMSFTRHRALPSGDYYFNTVKTPMRNIRGEVTGVLGVSRDISEIKKMETELATARAAEAVSNVARPMAHDFNNALAAINGYATLIDDDLRADSPIKKEISRIIEAVKRAAELTSKFQDFARNPDIKNPGGAGDRKAGGK